MRPPQSQVFVPSQKTVVVSKILLVFFLLLCQKYGLKPPRKTIETFDWKTLMFHVGS